MGDFRKDDRGNLYFLTLPEESFIPKNKAPFPAFYYVKVSLYFITVKPHYLDYPEKTI